ncbi:MAG: (2Fe-2S)-binding protein [Alphaproteobacteria bacterium]|nr:(2Fe-2S)-binding protein [Alphaproteobacteria bacterium]
MKLEVNGVIHELDVEDEMPLLWALREELGLRGTRFGCGMGLCGACTVHVDGRAQRSCVTPVSMVAGKPVRTIEDLGSPEAMHPVQQEWLRLSVPQCGYCQPGMQMAAVAFLDQRQAEAPDADLPPPTDEEVRRAITNICRCGCYERIRRAVVKAGTVG